MRAVKPAPRGLNGLRPAVPEVTARGNTRPGTVAGFVVSFFLGYVPGILLGHSGQLLWAADLAAYYMDAQNFVSLGTVWAAGFAALFIQLIAVALCGFSALGVPFLAASFAARGAYLGLRASCVYTLGGSKAFVIHWLLTCVTDVGGFLLSMWLGLYAADLASGLTKAVFSGGAARNALFAAARRLILRCCIAILAAGIVSAVGAALSVLFGGILL